MKTYEIIDHTADIGIRVYGKDPETLFFNAANAMFEVMLEATKKKPIPKRVKHKKFMLNKKGSSLEDVFVAWLGELLYLFATEGLIMDKADIQALDSSGIHAEITGKIFDPDFDRIKTEIKAVTYHELEVIKTDKGYQAEVIFDI
ncbi:MAG: archease [Candidatus Omnitrophota bacterium]